MSARTVEKEIPHFEQRIRRQTIIGSFR